MQTKWRIAGGLAVALATLLVWYGVEYVNKSTSPLYLFIYWSIFVVCILVAFYCVLLDIRFIRVQFAMERRRIFQDTVGDQAFRKALNAAYEKKTPPNSGEPSGGDE